MLTGGRLQFPALLSQLPLANTEHTAAKILHKFGEQNPRNFTFCVLQSFWELRNSNRTLIKLALYALNFHLPVFLLLFSVTSYFEIVTIQNTFTKFHQNLLITTKRYQCIYCAHEKPLMKTSKEIRNFPVAKIHHFCGWKSTEIGCWWWYARFGPNHFSWSCMKLRTHPPFLAP